MKKRLGLIIVVLFVLQSAIWGMGTSQSVIEHQVDLGQTVEGNFRIFTDETAINIDIYHWTISEDGETVIFQDLPFTENWIVIPKYLEKIEPSLNYVDVPYTIKLNEAEKAEYLAKLFITEQTSSSSNFSFSIGIGIPVYIAIKEKMNFGCEIADIGYDVKEENLKVKINNLGNVHIRPNVDIQIYKKEEILMFSQEKFLGKEELTKDWPILGKSRRNFVKKLALENGEYKIIFNTEYGKLYDKELSKQDVKILVVREI